jgi:small subunit ribosomal protein S1
VHKKKIAASVRETTENPWDTLTLEPGDVVETVITNKTNFGFFITVAEGIEGLIHNNELAWTNIEKKAMMESLSVGDTVKAVLLEIDKGNHRLSFSIKHLTQPPFHV